MSSDQGLIQNESANPLVELKEILYFREPQKSYWSAYRVFSTYGTNFSGVFKRRPSNLECIDGLRAIAILWVYVIHVSLYVDYKFWECLFLPRPWLFHPAVNGDLGVDIFFVISGFLISFILLKEKDKFGDIDYKHFLRNRFLRIWPAMAFYVILTSIGMFFDEKRTVQGILKHFSQLLFINNLLGAPLTHLWSVAVEFQFYLISPFIVTRLDGWTLPLSLCLFSTLLNVFILFLICGSDFIPYGFFISSEAVCGNKFETTIYNQMFTRMSPYICGMVCAQRYLKGVKAPNLAMEMVAFIVLVAISWVGASGMINRFYLPAVINNVWTCIARQVFGVCLSYILFQMLSREKISKVSPVFWLKSFLSLKVWVPIANLSYTIYLWHLTMMSIVLAFPFANGDKFKDADGNDPVGCPYSAGKAFGILIFNYTFGFSFVFLVCLVFLFTLVEKPAYDARMVYKRRGAKN